MSNCKEDDNPPPSATKECQKASKPPCDNPEQQPCAASAKPPPAAVVEDAPKIKPYINTKPSCSTVCQEAKQDEQCPVPDVCGLSERCVLKRDEPLGPCAGKEATYKAPEYYSYDRFSYAEAMIEMQCYRLPQPSSVKKANKGETKECKCMEKKEQANEEKKSR